MKKNILLAFLVIASALASSAAVTVQGWWHLDTAPTPTGDSSGLNRNFTSAFSTHPNSGGNMGALGIINGAGGPLGTTGFRSTNCIRLGLGVPTGKRQSAMWGNVGYNLPASNFGLEMWMLPQNDGYINGSTWVFSSGQTGGVALRIRNNGDGTSSFEGGVINGNYNNMITIGTPVLIDTNKWTHLAILNFDGTNYFYVNGVVSGPGNTNNTTSAGDMYIGTPDDNQAYDGYLDEARIFTFASGAFSTNDLLLRPAGPNFIVPPASTTVWDGGAAPFEVIASFDSSLTYAWLRSGAPIGGANTNKYVLPTAVAADSGSTFASVLTGNSISVTSSPAATLTVVAANPSDVAAYRNLINAEGSLIAYFPVDGCTGLTVTNTKNATYNGTLEGATGYDGRTNRVFGQRALLFDADGDVQIPNNPAFEFGTGNGTVEAVIYLSRAPTEDPTIFSVEYDGGTAHQVFGVTRDGNSLTYLNDAGSLTWPVSPNLIGRKAHVAFTVQNGTEITAVVDGLSLGTKTNTAPSSTTGSPAWIGARGNISLINRWVGDIDELAIYNTALSQSTLQNHYSKFFYGTNTVAPSIVSQPGSKTLLAGSATVLRVQATGTLPLTYQWKTNGVDIPGANSATLTLANTTTGSSGNYTLYVTNAIGWTNSQPIALTFIAAPSPYSAAVAADGPAAYWRLGDTSGTTAVDSSGFNNGTFSGSYTLGAAGLVTGTANAGDANNSVTFAPSSKSSATFSPDLNNPAGPFSVEFWTVANSVGIQCAISSQNRAGSRAGFTIFQNNGGSGFSALMGNSASGTVFVNGATTVEAGKIYHVVLSYDGTTCNLYVNGVLDVSTAIAFGPGGFEPNASAAAPFQIGARNSGDGFPYDGRIDEVAVYKYALSEAQVSNHWHFVWAAANITSNPTGVTTNEWSTVTLSAAATGVPNTYQWQKDTVDLSPVNNPDGTPHYPNGVNGLTLTISQVHPADAGQYRLVVSNPLGGATSANASVVINPDITKPTVTSVTALPTPNPAGGTNPYAIKVAFSELVDSTSAGTVGNYSVNGGVIVNSVTLSANNLAAYLATTGLVPGQKYTVNISGVKDQAQTPNTMLPTAASAWAPVLTQGVNWDFYPAINNGVANLLASPFYPIAPYTNVNFSTFNSTPFTGGDLNTRPGFTGGLGENYGCSLSGWITPTTTTNYYFYLASDDASELFLSTDANPSNAVSIAVETGCCHGFQEPGNPTTSAAIPLAAGVSYFIRALQTEGGGGDYVRVAWKAENDPTASTNLVAISGSVLKSYAPLPPPQFNPLSFNPGTGQLTISWTGVGTLYQSANLVSWTPVAGNPASPYIVNVGAAPYLFYRLVRE